MNSINNIHSGSQTAWPRGVRQLPAVCLYCWQKVLRRLDAVKARVEREFGRALSGYEHLLRGAINEAEALAWQTPHPHLLFPLLAEEKAAGARQWLGRQRAIRARAYVP